MLSIFKNSNSKWNSTLLWDVGETQKVLILMADFLLKNGQTKKYADTVLNIALCYKLQGKMLNPTK